MQPTAFCDLVLEESKIEEIADLYGKWILGKGQFSKLRRGRIRLGVDKSASVEDLISGGNFQHTDNSSIRIRVQDENSWIAHWSHADNQHKDIRWHNVIKLHQENTNVLLTHLSARNLPVDKQFAPIAAPPQTFEAILDVHKGQIYPKNLFLDKAVRLNEGDVEEFVNHVLLDGERKANVVLVTPDNQSEQSLVDVAVLSKWLRGMATVVSLETVNASWELKNCLIERGFHYTLSTYNGAVRLYRPDVYDLPESYSHRLFLPDRIKRLHEKYREQNLAGYVVQEIVNGSAQHLTLSAIEEIDRTNWKEESYRVLNRDVETVTSDEVEELREAIRDREEKIIELKDVIKDGQEWQEYLEREVKELELRDQDHILRHAELEQRFEENAQGLVGGLNFGTAHEALVAAETLYQSGFIVLDSAKRSAIASPFRDPNLVFEVLSILAMSRGEKDYIISKVIGSRLGNRGRWRPKDSKKTEKTFKKERTFPNSNGKETLYKTHITLGHGEHEATCMQVYYRKFGNGLIEVAYAGKHLSTFGKNT